MTCPLFQLRVLEHQRKYRELCKELAPTLLKLAMGTVTLCLLWHVLSPPVQGLRFPFKAQTRSLDTCRRSFIQSLSSTLGPPRGRRTFGRPVSCKTHGEINSSSLFTSHQPSTSAINPASYHQPPTVSSKFALDATHP